MTIGEPIAWIEMVWATNYDPSQMRLELWRQRYDGSNQLVWAELRTGVQGGAANIHFDQALEGPYYFKVAVIPEPCGATILSFSIGALLVMLRKRR